MILADRIRAYVLDHYIRPAVQAGRDSLRIRAGDVHSDMGLLSRLPAVCAALDSRKLQEEAGVELVRREGPRQGANAIYEFAIAHARPAKPARRIDGRAQRDRPAMRPPTSATAGVGSVYLVSCVAKKRRSPAPARDLYTSAWFVKARAFVERTGMPWYILSADHGLVAPETRLAPYERTLNTMTARERREWARYVARQIGDTLPDVQRVIFLAGARYREHLVPYFRERGVEVDIPLAGLRIGEQLSWFDRQSRDEPPV